MATFVVASEEMDGGGVVDLERKEVKHTFATKVSSVDVVAQKQVAGGCGVTANFKQLHQVEILSVDIAGNCTRAYVSRKSELSMSFGTTDQ